MITPCFRSCIIAVLSICLLFVFSSVTRAETDVTSKVQVIKSALTYDRRAQTSSFDVSLKNISQDILLAPIKVVVESISDVTVKVTNADGSTSDGKPYFLYATTDQRFSINQTIGPKRWTFSNPKTARFTYTYTVVAAGQPEASGIVGPAGGAIEVNNTNSPLHGVKVQVPEGTFVNSNAITISVNTAPLPKPLPDDVTPDGPAISFDVSDPTFQKSVLMFIPLSAPVTEDEATLVYTFNEASSNWELVGPVSGPDPNVFVAMVNHFSLYQRVKTAITHNENEIIIPFRFNWDTLQFTNDNKKHLLDQCPHDPDKKGVCAGMASIVTQYFNEWTERETEGLWCRWGEERAAQASCEAQGVYKNSVQRCTDALAFLFLGSGAVADSSSVLATIKQSLKQGKTIQVSITNASLFKNAITHDVVAYGWRKTTSFCGEIDIYNVNSNTDKEKMTYCGIGPFVSMKFVSKETGIELNRFYIPTILKNETDAVIDKYSSEHRCSVPPVLSADFIAVEPQDETVGDSYRNLHTFWFCSHLGPTVDTWRFDFGDGASASGRPADLLIVYNGDDVTSIFNLRDYAPNLPCVEHEFPDDRGPFTVTFSVKDFDGNTASSTQEFFHPMEYSISGYVYRLGSLREVRMPGIPVTLKGDSQKTTLTDEDGEFSFVDIPPGSYSMEVTPPTGFIYWGPYNFKMDGYFGPDNGDPYEPYQNWGISVEHEPPVIAMGPRAGPPGTVFTQWGTGFIPNTTATLHFRKPDGSEYAPLNVAINSEGNFEISYRTEEDKPQGAYTWWAVDGYSEVRSNEVTYIITGLSVPTIAQSPMSGPPGTTFTQWGTGFTANSTATLHIEKPDGSEYNPQTINLNSIGHFEITYRSESDKPRGAYTWWVIDNSTGKKSNEVTYRIE